MNNPSAIRMVGPVGLLCLEWTRRTCAEDLLRRWQRIDMLVTCAGRAYYSLSCRMTAEHWRQVLEVNLDRTMHFVHELLLPMRGSPRTRSLMSSMYGIAAERTLACLFREQGGPHRVGRCLWSEVPGSWGHCCLPWRVEARDLTWWKRLESRSP